MNCEVMKKLLRGVRVRKLKKKKGYLWRREDKSCNGVRNRKFFLTRHIPQIEVVGLSFVSINAVFQYSKIFKDYFNVSFTSLFIFALFAWGGAILVVFLFVFATFRLHQVYAAPGSLHEIALFNLWS